MKNLTPGEVIICQTRLHKIIFFRPILVTLLAIILSWASAHGFVTTTFGDNSKLSRYVALSVCFISALYTWVATWINYLASEFVITNKRASIKFGFIRRRIFEILLSKTQSVDAQQSVAGRIFNYGSVTLFAFGGQAECFQPIADPLTFRETLQNQIDAAQKSA